MSVVLSEEFKEKVRSVWSEGSTSVIDVLDNEAWDLGVHGEDHDDQVTTAQELGILVGLSRSEGSDSLFARFELWVKQNGEDYEEDAQDGLQDERP